MLSIGCNHSIIGSESLGHTNRYRLFTNIEMEKPTDFHGTV